MTRSMAICGLLMVAMAVGFCGCATPTGELSPIVQLAPSSNGSLGGLPDVTVGATTEGPSLIPSGSLTARGGECGPELVGEVKHHLDEPIGESGLRWEQKTTVAERIYTPCPEPTPNEPETPPDSAPEPKAKPTSSYQFDGGPSGKALPDRSPAIVWQAPEPHARGAHAPILRVLWRYGEVVRL